MLRLAGARPLDTVPKASFCPSERPCGALEACGCPLGLAGALRAGGVLCVSSSCIELHRVCIVDAAAAMCTKVRQHPLPRAAVHLLCGAGAVMAGRPH